IRSELDKSMLSQSGTRPRRKTKAVPSDSRSNATLHQARVLTLRFCSHAHRSSKAITAITTIVTKNSVGASNCMIAPRSSVTSYGGFLYSELIGQVRAQCQWQSDVQPSGQQVDSQATINQSRSAR